MEGLYGIHNVAKSYLAWSRVVPLQSRTNAARSFVLVSALGDCCQLERTLVPEYVLPFSPPAPDFRRYNKSKIASLHTRCTFEMKSSLFWNAVTWRSLFNGVASGDISGAVGKLFPDTPCYPFTFKTYLYSFLLVGLPVRWDDDERHCLICHVGIA